MSKKINKTQVLEEANLSKIIYDLSTDVGNGKTLGEYLLNNDKNIVTSSNKEYRVISIENDTNSGYYGMLVQDTQTNKYILVNRGTEITTLSDVATDIAMVAEALPKQFEVANNFMTEAINIVGTENLTITGHSLGGSISQYLSLVSGISSTTFNAYNISEIEGVSSILYNQEYITNIVTENDWVSSLSTELGDTITLPESSNAHSIDSLIDLINSSDLFNTDDTDTPDSTPTSPTQELIILSDTTGSMSDNIASVKSHAAIIANSILNTNPNNKIGVYGYNDPSTQVFCNLTNDKSIVIDSINSLYASDGGDYKEPMYAGILNAINNASWSEDSKKSIIIFSDAPAKDTQLYDEVYNALYNLKNNRSLNNDNTTNIQIYAIQSGDDATLAEQFQALASISDGKYINLEQSNYTNVAEAILDITNNIKATNANDIIFGTTSNNIIEGKGGNDILAGLAANDKYIFSGDFGNDIIIDNDGANEISFIDDTTIDNLRFTLDKQNLTIYKDDNNSIEILDFGDNISQINFSDTTFLTNTDIKNILFMQDNDIYNNTNNLYIYNKNDGINDIIDNNGDDIILITGYSKDESKFIKDNDDLIISFKDSNDKITIKNHYAGTIKNNKIENIIFDKEKEILYENLNDIVNIHSTIQQVQEIPSNASFLDALQTMATNKLIQTLNAYNTTPNIIDSSDIDISKINQTDNINNINNMQVWG